MQNIIIIICIAALALVGLGTFIGDSINVNLSAGPVAQGEKTLLESQADQNQALAEQTRQATEQKTLDHIARRDRIERWFQTTNKQWNNLWANLAIIFKVVGWSVALISIWFYLRVANAAATGLSIQFLLRGIVNGIAPKHQRRRGDPVSSVFMPTANRTLVMHDGAPDIHTEMSHRGTHQLQNPDPLANAARAMSLAHGRREAPASTSDASIWQGLWAFVGPWMSRRRKDARSETTTIVPRDDDVTIR